MGKYIVNLLYLIGDDLNSSSILVSKLTGLHALQPCHRFGQIEEETAHVDRGPVYPSTWAWSLRERSWRLTGHEVREREDSEQKTDEGAHRFMFSGTLTSVVKLQVNIAEMTSTVKQED